jgi:hypothetical protein
MQIFDLRHVPDEIFSGGEFFVANFAARLLVFGRPVSFDAEKYCRSWKTLNKPLYIKKSICTLFASIRIRGKSFLMNLME